MVYGLSAPYEQVALEGHTDNVTSCVWNPDGTRLATASSAVTKTVGGKAAQHPQYFQLNLIRSSCTNVPVHTHRIHAVPRRTGFIRFTGDLAET